MDGRTYPFTLDFFFSGGRKDYYFRIKSAAIAVGRQEVSVGDPISARDVAAERSRIQQSQPQVEGADGGERRVGARVIGSQRFAPCREGRVTSLEENKRLRKRVICSMWAR